jgi:tetratricopeptide (TPR) repeat protein
MSDKMFEFDDLHSAIFALRSKQIFFIGGAIKSGTTWLQLLLDAHPDVSCRGESHLPNHFAPLLQAALEKQNRYISRKNVSIFKELEGYPQFSSDHFTYLLASSIALLLHEQSKHKSARVIGEKTPNSIRFFELLGALFPNAKMIQIIRDGRDCAVSGWFHNLRSEPEEIRKSFDSMDDYVINFAEIWHTAVSKGSAFGVRHPTRYLALRYEDLNTDPEGTLAGVFRFLGVECSQAIVRKCCAEGSFRKVSGRTPGQENRESFFRKGVSGDWRNHLSDKVNEKFKERAGEWLTRFGYLEGKAAKDPAPSIAFDKALLLHQQGRFGEAERLYRAILKAEPGDFHALFNLGTMRAQQRRFGDAIKLFNQALAIRPDHTEAQNNLRIVTLAQNEEALAHREDRASSNLAPG